MPTENRSSNTEQMVSVPRDEVERLVKLLQYQAHPYPSPHAEFWQGLLDAPAAQHRGEPVAYWVIDEFGQKKVVLPGSETVARGKARGYAMRPLYFHPPTSDGFSAGDMADQGAKAFAARDPEVEALRAALQFYADRDHFSEDMGSDWDNVSGEPANILWHESEAWFVEDGSIARAVLSGSAASPVEYGPTPGCKQCEEAEACGLTDCPECDAQLCEDVNGDGVRPDA